MIKTMVSVIMPTYNRGYVIRRAIESVLDQTYKNIELIIVDDGSTDNTSSIVKTYQDDRIHFITYQKNRGACHARNTGLESVNGEYVAFLDSDDVWYPDCLEYAINELSKGPSNLGGIIGRVEMLDDEQNVLVYPNDLSEMIGESSDNRPLINEMLIYNVMTMPAVVIKRECIDRIDGFDENLSRLQDWDFYLRLLVESGYVFVFRNHLFAKVYKQKDSISNDWSAFWRSRFRIISKNNDLIKEYKCRDRLYRSLSSLASNVSIFHEMIFNFKEYNKAYLTIMEDFIYYLITKEIEERTMNDNISQELRKQYLFYTIWNEWSIIHQNGERLTRYFEQRKLYRVAVYGIKELGQRLCDELIGSNIKVVYVIDRDISLKYRGIEVRTPDLLTDDIDIIVVTAVYYYEEIHKDLTHYGSYEVASLLDIVNNCLEDIQNEK